MQCLGSVWNAILQSNFWYRAVQEKYNTGLIHSLKFSNSHNYKKYNEMGGNDIKYILFDPDF